MYNNTLILTEEYNTSSSIRLESEHQIQENCSELSIDESINSFGYLYSIELNRNKIKTDLSEFFDFETNHNELDFLASNIKLQQLLPGIAKYIKNTFDSKSRLVLELMSESKNWQTLFINIYTRVNWENSNKFIDEILENLFDLDPEIAQKLNLNIVPNEF